MSADGCYTVYMTTKIKTSVKRSRFFLSSLVGFLAVSALSIFLPSVGTRQGGALLEIPKAQADAVPGTFYNGGCESSGDGYSGCDGCDGCAGSDGACE